MFSTVFKCYKYKILIFPSNILHMNYLIKIIQFHFNMHFNNNYFCRHISYFIFYIIKIRTQIKFNGINLYISTKLHQTGIISFLNIIQYQFILILLNSK